MKNFFRKVGFDTHATQVATDDAYTKFLKEYDRIVKSQEASMRKESKNTLVLILTEFERTIKQNSSNVTEHFYGTAVLMSGGLIKKLETFSDCLGLKRKELSEGRKLNSTIDARFMYASAMFTVFNVEFKKIIKEVFWGEKLYNLPDKIFKT